MGVINNNSKRSSAAFILLVLLLIVLFATRAKAQNVGIGTNSPQAKLDVKGSFRAGGINKYLLYDSTTGQYTWSNSYIWAPNPLYLMMHSASAEGLYYGNSQLEYRNSSGNPVFFTNWSNGSGYFNGSLGVGTLSPASKLHIQDGSTGILPNFANLILERNTGHNYMSFFTPDNYESAMLFYTPSQSLLPSGGIFYNSNLLPYGFIFRTNSAPRMYLNNNGDLGIGISSPGAKLHVYNGGSGYSSGYFPGAVIEGSTNTYLDFLTPNGSESAVLFGRASDAAHGGIIYNNPATVNGLQFRTNGNTTRMVISNAGNVGIGGSTDPTASLDVYRGTGTNGTAVFRGTQYLSHFNYSTTENTYIRGGKDGAYVLLNDVPGMGNVGVGLPNPSEKLEVSGNVKAASYKFTTAKTYYYTVPASAFRPEDNSDRVIATYYGIYFNNASQNSSYLYAGVNLPHGATVTNLAAYYQDDSGPYDLTVKLMGHTHTATSSASILASVSSGGTPGNTNSSTSLILDAVINNQLTDYLVEAITTANSWPGSNLVLRAVVITYMISEAQ